MWLHTYVTIWAIMLVLLLVVHVLRRPHPVRMQRVLDCRTLCLASQRVLLFRIPIELRAQYRDGTLQMYGSGMVHHGHHITLEVSGLSPLVMTTTAVADADGSATLHSSEHFRLDTCEDNIYMRICTSRPGDGTIISDLIVLLEIH